MKNNSMILFFFFLLSCSNTSQSPPQYKTEEIAIVEQNVDLKQVSDIPLPRGYTRMTQAKGSFGEYLSHIKLKQNATVYLFDGRKKGNQTAQYAVLDVSVGERDLQQCADAVMRLRAEYLYAQKAFDKIAFHAVSGENMRFVDWANGRHKLLKNNELSKSLNKGADVSYPNFLKYMNFVFAYASTLSLVKELPPLSKSSDIEAGDVFIKGGSPGHAVIVLDVAKNSANGKKCFLIAQSYMPAQDIHILKNFNDNILSPWYSEDFGDILETPEWDFDKKALSRFAN